MSATVIASGASLSSLQVPARDQLLNVVLGYEHFAAYASDPYYMGSTVGRYANRIAGGATRIGEKDYRLDINERPSGNCLHGGRGGLHRQRWQLDASSDTIRCRYRSPDGDQGFPGNVELEVNYQFVAANGLMIEFLAEADRETVLNLTNHAYFNLDAGAGLIDEHTLSVDADEYTPVDDKLIPTGVIAPVSGTSLDFRFPRPLGSQKLDTNFVVRGTQDALRPAATLCSQKSGLSMRVSTTQPGLQVYTADDLGAPFRPRQAICLEPQNFPDAPNRPDFPSAVIVPGERYRQTVLLEFDAA